MGLLVTRISSLLFLFFFSFQRGEVMEEEKSPAPLSVSSSVFLMDLPVEMLVTIVSYVEGGLTDKIKKEVKGGRRAKILYENFKNQKGEKGEDFLKERRKALLNLRGTCQKMKGLAEEFLLFLHIPSEVRRSLIPFFCSSNGQHCERIFKKYIRISSLLIPQESEKISHFFTHYKIFIDRAFKRKDWKREIQKEQKDLLKRRSQELSGGPPFFIFPSFNRPFSRNRDSFFSNPETLRKSFIPLEEERSLPSDTTGLMKAFIVSVSPKIEELEVSWGASPRDYKKDTYYQDNFLKQMFSRESVFPCLKKLKVKGDSSSLNSLDFFSQCPGLKVLTLSSMSLGFRDVQSLLKAPFFSCLTSLDLSYNELENESVQALAEVSLPSLLTLSLGHNRITCANELFRAPLPELRELDIGWNSLKSLDLASLVFCSFSRLTRLCLDCTHLPKDTFRNLSQASFCELTEWDFSTSFLPKYLELQDFVDLIDHYKNLETLFLPYWDTDLARALKGLYPRLMIIR